MLQKPRGLLKEEAIHRSSYVYKIHVHGKKWDFWGGLPYSRIFQVQNLGGQVLWHACRTSAKNFNWLVVDFFKSIITSNPEMKSQVKIVMPTMDLNLFLWNITLVNPMDLHFHAFILYLQESQRTSNHTRIMTDLYPTYLTYAFHLTSSHDSQGWVPSSKLTWLPGKSIKFNIGHTPSLKHN